MEVKHGTDAVADGITSAERQSLIAAHQGMFSSMSEGPRAVESSMEAFQVIQGDCARELTRLQSDTVDLVVTSPPYADQRTRTYGGITPDGYVAWFLPKKHSTSV